MWLSRKASAVRHSRLPFQVRLAIFLAKKFQNDTFSAIFRAFGFLNQHFAEKDWPVGDLKKCNLIPMCFPNG